MPEVYDSVEAMLAGAGSRRAMAKNADSLSGSPFEHVVIDGADHVLKYVGYDLDWLARALEDRDCFVRTLWTRGLLDRLPKEIDHTIVAIADTDSGAAVLMRDIHEHLMPEGAVDHDSHRSFLKHMATMHATFWDFSQDEGLLPPGNRYTALTPQIGSRELNDPVPQALRPGWSALSNAAKPAHDKVLALAEDPAPLVDELAKTPATFIHGDWKFGNLGRHKDGRTILLDWGWPGRAAPLVDLGWYLGVNCDRLPESKEDTITAYRGELEALGVDTGQWWDRQLELALLGTFVQIGWSKTHDPAELGWWTERIVRVDL